MAYYENNYRQGTENGPPIVGGLVTVNDANGSLANLNDENGVEIDNPLTTDTQGAFSFYAPDGYYTFILSVSGNVVRTDANQRVGSPDDTNQRAVLVPVGEAPVTLPTVPGNKKYLVRLPDGSIQHQDSQSVLITDSLGPATDIAPSQNAVKIGLGRKLENIGLAADVAGLTSSIATSLVQTSGASQLGAGVSLYALSVDQATSSNGYARLQDPFSGAYFDLAENIIEPEMFGAKRDAVLTGTLTDEGDVQGASLTGTDDTAAFVAAIAYLRTLGGGVLRLTRSKNGSAAGGTTLTGYRINGSIKLYPNIIIEGPGIDSCYLFAGADGVEMFSRHDAPAGGTSGMRRFTMWGTADRNPTQSNVKLVNVWNFDTFGAEDVRCMWTRSLTFCPIAKNVNIKNYQSKYTLRDALNVTGSNKVCVDTFKVEYAGDDSVAASIAAGNTGVIDTEIRIFNGHLRKALGLKALGARTTIIAGNTGKFVYNYGVWLGVDTSFGEGIGPKYNVIFANNTFTDMISGPTVGSGAINGFIFVNGAEYLGSGSTTWDVYEGQLSSSGTIRKPAPYDNYNGLAYPRPTTANILIANNTVRQTIATSTERPIAKFSDSGFGKLWFTSGFIDPALTTLIGAVDFFSASSVDLRNILVGPNIVEGLRHGVNVACVRRFDKAVFYKNQFTRMTGNGFQTNHATQIHGQIVIDDNIFDIDPFLEMPDRSASAGTWGATDGSNGFGVLLTNHVGAIIRGNSFENCRRPYKGINSVAEIINNRQIWDWSGSAAGIALALGESSNKSFFRNSNPSSPNYGQYSTTADSGFVEQASAMPSSGYYRAGQFVRNSAQTVSAGKILRGWIRLTNGNAHVAGTDWSPVYVTTS